MNLQTEKVRKLLVEQGVTPSELARSFGCSRQNIYQILSKERCRLKTARRLAVFLKVNVADIISEEFDPSCHRSKTVWLTKEAASAFGDFMEMYAAQGGRDGVGKMASKMILYAIENAEFAGEDERQCRE